MSSEKVRFAPSPTGRLHVGNVRTALVNYLFARHQGGQFMLRIDDTDIERSTAEFETSIRDDLNWLGMGWDCEDRQSNRLERYDDALARLVAAGRAYPCFETAEELGLKRKAQLMAGKPPVYDRAALKLTPEQIEALKVEGKTPHYRFLLNHEQVSWTDLVRGEVSYHMSSLSDPVLMREDGRVIYTLASVVDDIDHGITTILRGEDHVTNSAAQIQLFEALGSVAPKMGHLALLAGMEGEGLSKRLGSLSITQLREDGIQSAAITSLLGRIGTSNPIEAFSDMQPLIETFDMSAFGRSTAKFSHSELEQINAKLLQGLAFDEVKAQLSASALSEVTAEFWEVVKGNLNRLEDAGMWWKICYQPIAPDIEDAVFIAKAAAFLPEGELDADSWSVWTKAVSAETGVKGRDLFMPLRKALTGQAHGPDMGRLLPFIGRQTVLARLQGRTA